MWCPWCARQVKLGIVTSGEIVDAESVHREGLLIQVRQHHTWSSTSSAEAAR
jgi:hypothetical protein